MACEHWERHAPTPLTYPPTHADGLRDAAAIKAIHLKSPTVTNWRKPAAGTHCSLRHEQFLALSWDSRGLSVWPSLFLITRESRKQLLYGHICVSVSQPCGGLSKKQSRWYGKHCLRFPPPIIRFLQLIQFNLIQFIYTVYSQFTINIFSRHFTKNILSFTHVFQLILSNSVVSSVCYYKLV